MGQVDLTAKLYLSFCLELQSAKSTYQHVDLDLYSPFGRTKVAGDNISLFANLLLTECQSTA